MMEVLIEEMMGLLSSTTTFRQVFKSQQITQQFIEAYKGFTNRVNTFAYISEKIIRLLEKLNHFGTMLTLDYGVAGSQKQEVYIYFPSRVIFYTEGGQQIVAVLRLSEDIINPNSEKTVIDPGLVADTRTVRQRFASARLSMHVGERAVIKTITRMSDWRRTVVISERKRLRKTVLDLFVLKFWKAGCEV